MAREGESRTTREHEIRSAAARLFCERGYHSATLRDLGRRVGMEAPSLYNHFASKQELLAALIVGTNEELLDCIRAAVKRAGREPVEQLKAAVAAFVLFHDGRLEETRVADAEVRTLEPPHRERVLALRDDIGAEFKRIVRAGARQGVFAVEDAALASLAIVSMCARLGVWYRPGGRLRLPTVAERLASLALSTVGAGSA